MYKFIHSFISYVYAFHFNVGREIIIIIDKLKIVEKLKKNNKRVNNYVLNAN